MSKLTVIYGVCSLVNLAIAIPVLACEPNLAMPQTTPASDFVFYDNGTALHVLTGLIWKRCAEGQSWVDSGCIGNSTDFTWQAALQHADTASFAGESDWRLPNIRELQSIVEHQCHVPNLNPVVFPDQALAAFWSSSPSLDDNSFGGQFVNFAAAYLMYVDFHVRLVRRAD